ncbi:MAG: GAF domain-containing protein [Reyranellaceae bacterium]
MKRALAAARTERDEARAQQAAVAAILRRMASSRSDPQPVFDEVARAAARLCAADVCVALRFGERWRVMAHEGPIAMAVGHEEELTLETTTGRALLGNRTEEVHDILASDPERFAAAHRLSREQGFRSVLAVPLRRDGVAIGVIGLRRAEPGPFGAPLIALLESFADQAVIALETVRLFTDLGESLDQQTATAEVLKVISRSPTDVRPVLDVVVEAARRFCGATDAVIGLRDGADYVVTAHAGPLGEEIGGRRALDRTTTQGRAILDGRTVHNADVTALDAAEWGTAHVLARRFGFKAALGAPMLRDGSAIGAVTLRRADAGLFTPRQVALLESFAAQAVIAIENSRLFAELGARNRELSDSLEQQTASAEILRVISQSPTDVAPVLDALVAAARRFCGGEDAVIVLRDGQAMVVGAHDGVIAAVVGRRVPLDRSSTMGRAVVDGRTVHHPDVAALDPAEFPTALGLTREMGVAALLAAPMLSDGGAVGAILLRRRTPGAFTPRQIELVESFAAQAVIALQNTRLFGELTEALARQTATAEILGTINGSRDDLQPVFDVILAKAMAQCDAAFGVFNTFDGTRFHTIATRGVPEAFARYRTSSPPDYGPGTTPARLIDGEDFVHVHDMADSDLYRSGDPSRRAIVDAGGARTVLNVALRKDGMLRGTIIVYRQQVRPFSDKQIALLRGFADQAVIAMENARLLGELTRREQELRVTFDHMGDGVVMFDADLTLASWNRNFQELLDIPDTFLATRPSLADYVRLLVGRGELGQGESESDAEAEIARYRRRVGEAWSIERTRPDGRIVEVRNNPVPGGGAVLIYGDVTARKQAEAAIRAARDAAEAALDQLKAAQANLVQSEKMASLGQLTAGIAHEIKNPLNFVNNFASLSVDLLDELRELAGPAFATLDGERRAEIDETMALLIGNLGKIAEHGKRADGIVRSMLSHSRGGTGDWQESNLDSLVEEALNLAYHGARAQDPEFNVTLERDLAAAGTPIELVPQDVTRVFLNLFGNGFYATRKRRQAAAGDPSWRPTLTVATRDLGEAVEMRVRDNGTGIAPDVREKLFQPFFTTKPTGEGTGLGLSISWDIVTQQHGGTIEVTSEPGVFTEFTVRLPRRRRTVERARG